MTPSGAALEEVRLSGDRAARPAKASSPPETLMPPAIPSAPRASVPLSFASPPETERVWPVGMRRVPEAASSSPPDRDIPWVAEKGSASFTMKDPPVIWMSPYTAVGGRSSGESSKACTVPSDTVRLPSSTPPLKNSTRPLRRSTLPLCVPAIYRPPSSQYSVALRSKSTMTSPS